MRLIDADDRIEFIKNAYCPGCDNYNGVRCKACSINDMIEVIDNAPTVDLWHYPSRGELSTDGEEILCKLPYKGYAVDKYNTQFEYFDFGNTERTPINIECWQYIIPPKENK